MSNTIEIVVELQSLLTELKREQARHDSPPPEVEELHEKHEAVSARIEELDAIIHQAELDRRRAEATINDLEEKVDHFQAQTSRVTTQREHQALLSEIDSAKTLQKEQEGAAIEAMEHHEASGTELETLREEFSALDEEYRSLAATWEQERPAILARIEQLKIETEVLREKLPKKARTLFERLYERHSGDPLARVESIERPGSAPSVWRCSVCNYSVRPQVVVEIQSSGELISCDCGRQKIFYLDVQ